MKEHRNTKQREEVLNSVKSLCNHPSAEEVYYYARENNLNVVLRTTDAIGLPVDAFIPYFNLVVDGFEHSRKIKAVKKSLCNQNGITYCEINSKDPFAMAAQIKALFRKNHVYITSENENDIRFCRNLFFSVKRKNARTS